MAEILEFGKGVLAGKTFEEAVLNKPGFVLVVPYLEGCMGSIMYGQKLKEMAPQIGGNLSIVKVNFSEFQITAKELGIKRDLNAFPDSLLYGNGKLLRKWGHPATKAELNRQIGKAVVTKFPGRPANAPPGLVIHAQQRFKQDIKPRVS